MTPCCRACCAQRRTPSERHVILLWGLPADGPLASVHRALERMGAEVAFIDQHILVDSEIELTSGRSVSGAIRQQGREFMLDDVTAAYLRPYDPRRVLVTHGVEDGSVRWHLALSLQDALSCWSEMTPALVVNRPSAMASNNSKPYQTRLIARQGFAVPDTLVTTDVSAVAQFRRQHTRLVYKSVSGIRSIVSQLQSDDIDRLDDIVSCPTQFQEYIEGTDVRVHVVGEAVFACEVRSQADDYRYSQAQGADVEVVACSLPGDIQEGCLRLAKALDLALAGIDLRRTPSGDWYCFEANPSPGFTFFEEATGQPISDATARLLASAGRNS